LASLGGCGLLNGLFGSGEAAIVAFTMDGLVGGAVIDPAARTVTATVEPMLVSGLTPTVTVSEEATLSTRPTLVDGEAVTYVVTAENGDEVPWTVTLTVQRGISFTYGSTKVVLTGGVVDSDDPENNAAWGAGVPPASYYPDPGGTQGFVFDKPFEHGSLLVGEFARLVWFGEAATGVIDDVSAYFDYTVYGDPGVAISEVVSAATLPLTVTVLQFGAVGGDIVGTLTGTVVSSSSGEVPLTAGFFKLLRVPDNLM
jgi:hypothetical protein